MFFNLFSLSRHPYKVILVIYLRDKELGFHCNVSTGSILALSRDIQDKNHWFNANFNFSVTTLRIKPEMIKVRFIFFSQTYPGRLLLRHRRRVMQK